MMFAHVTDGTVDQVGGLPNLVFDGGRWWDLRTKDPALLASLGWYEVVQTDRPADTTTETSDLTYEFADGTVTQVWTLRDKTPAELDADARISDLESRVTLLESLVLSSVPPSEDAAEWTGEPVRPDGLIEWNGDVYKNISGAWLVADPSTYPIGWAKQGAPTAPWAVGIAYAVGDQVTYQGATYMCLTAHTSQAGWEPGVAPSLWQLL